MSFNSEIIAHLGWDWDEGARDDDRLPYEKRLLDGHGFNQAEAIWHLEDQTLLDGASVVYSLDRLERIVLGDTLTIDLTEVMALLIVNQSTSGGRLIVGNAPGDTWWEPFGAIDDTVEVPLDSALLLTNRRDGWFVGTSSSSGAVIAAGLRNLQLAALGGGVTYSIAIIGTLTGSSSGA